MRLNRYFYIVALSSSFLLIGGAMAKPISSENSLISPSQSVFVSEEEEPLLERQALEGSPKAATRLYSFYGMTGRTKEAIYWAEIATENGQENGPYLLGSLLIREPDINSLVRACFWLKRASNSGEKLADSLLKEYEAILHEKGIQCQR